MLGLSSPVSLGGWWPKSLPVRREAVWRHCLAIYPGGAAYARRAGTRVIGLFLLHPDAS